MPDNFTHQWVSAGAQWVNQTICQCSSQPINLQCTLLYYLLSLMPDNFIHQWVSAGAQWANKIICQYI